MEPAADEGRADVATIRQRRFAVRIRRAGLWPSGARRHAGLLSPSFHGRFRHLRDRHDGAGHNGMMPLE